MDLLFDEDSAELYVGGRIDEFSIVDIDEGDYDRFLDGITVGGADDSDEDDSSDSDDDSSSDSDDDSSSDSSSSDSDDESKEKTKSNPSPLLEELDHLTDAIEHVEDTNDDVPEPGTFSFSGGILGDTQDSDDESESDTNEPDPLNQVQDESDTNELDTSKISFTGGIIDDDDLLPEEEEPDSTFTGGVLEDSDHFGDALKNYLQE
jgi:hypothetical protein